MVFRKPWFKKLLLSYLPLFVGISIILILIFVLAAIEEAKREAERANSLYARQVLQSVDYSLRTVDQMILNEIGSNEIWRQFFNPQAGANKYLTEYELSKKLASIANNYPLIDSIYLVRFSDQIMMTNYARLELDNVMDKPFITQMQDQHITSYRFWTNPRDAQTIGALPHRMFSLVTRYPLLSGDEGMMIVNFQTSAIANLMASLSDSDLNYVMLCDGANQFIAGSVGKHAIYADDSRGASGASGDGDSSGGRDGGGGGCKQKNSLSMVQSDYTGWTVYSGINNGGYATIFTVLSSLWIVLAIFVVLGGMAAIIYLTARNYRPIGKIVDRIEGVGNAHNVAKHGRGKDELFYIERALDELIKQTGEDVIFKRKLFFQELFQGNRIIIHEEWEQQVQHLGWRHADAPLQAAVVDIDRYDYFCSQYSERDRGLIRFSLSNVITELAQTQGLAIWTEWLSNQRMGVLVAFDGTERNEQQLAFIAVMEAMVRWVNDNLRSITVTIALGITVEEIIDIGTSYESAVEALQYKSVFGNNRVISQTDLPIQSPGDVYHQLQPIRAMVTAYRLGEEKWREQFAAIMLELEQNVLSRDDIINLMNYMLYQLNRELSELPVEVIDYWKNSAAPSLEHAIDRIDTLQEFVASTQLILEQLAELIGQVREQSASNSMIQEVRQFIDEHYHNPDMSLTYIGEQFHIKSNYMSRLFKEETGENFVDYLARIRIQEAMRLLRETELSVQEITGLVGYSHYVSFNRVFKKVAGATPGDYRREAVR